MVERRKTWVFSLLLLVAAAQPALPVVPARAQGEVGSKQREAASLRSRIAEQGRRLSIADEEFNQARIERRSIEARLAGAQAEVAEAERRWEGLREKLSGRVRTLYMHPGASVEAWLGLGSLTESRTHVLNRSVLTADGELIDRTAAAGERVRAEATALAALRDRAVAAESDLEERRVVVAGELRVQRSLLASVNTDIARSIEAERQQKLAAAAAAEATPTAAPVAAVTPAPSAAVPAPTVAPAPSSGVTRASAAKAVATARAQIGKPYEWAAAGPNSFDCSGLTMYAWASAGVSLPHSSRSQYASLPKVSRGSLQPGDLVFYGSPIHHVGIYEGAGVMINAPETGENVRRDGIDRADYVGAARPG